MVRVALTGHRPNKIFNSLPYSEVNYQKLVSFCKHACSHLGSKHGEFRVTSGMALGFDQAFADAAQELKIPVMAAVPFKGQERLWPASSQKRYNRLIAGSTKVHVCTEVDLENYSEVVKALHSRNEVMIKHCDILVALYNGDQSGGTAHAVRSAQAAGKEVINIWDQWVKYRDKPYKAIKGFRDEYYFLSNMYPCKIQGYLGTFSCAETYFQAHKSGLLSDLKRFGNLNGFEAKKLGRTVKLQENWETEKLAVMKRGLLLKFSQNEQLRKQLLATGDTYLEETNEWKDTYWGVYQGKGQNMLGVLLMEVRKELA